MNINTDYNCLYLQLLLYLGTLTGEGGVTQLCKNQRERHTHTLVKMINLLNVASH